MTPLTGADMALRLGLAFAAGAIVGFERSARRQVAGLRTHILIAMGAALLMLLSIWLPGKYSDMKNGDPGRIAAQVVSGIGFLGAGAIIRLGSNVRGLTTAASLWFIAAVGMAIGAGMFEAAAIAEAAGLLTLYLLGKAERRIFPSERYKVLEISYKDPTPGAKAALETLTAAGVKVQSMDLLQSAKHKRSKLVFLVGIPSTVDIAVLARQLKAQENAARVEIKEKY